MTKARTEKNACRTRASNYHRDENGKYEDDGYQLFAPIDRSQTTGIMIDLTIEIEHCCLCLNVLSMKLSNALVMSICQGFGIQIVILLLVHKQFINFVD
jgi:hypothetical protein